MILDNENKNLKVHEWITSYTEQGKLDILTGYLTIGYTNNQGFWFRCNYGEFATIRI